MAWFGVGEEATNLALPIVYPGSVFKITPGRIFGILGEAAKGIRSRGSSKQFLQQFDNKHPTGGIQKRDLE